MRTTGSSWLTLILISFNSTIIISISILIAVPGRSSIPTSGRRCLISSILILILSWSIPGGVLCRTVTTRSSAGSSVVPDLLITVVVRWAVGLDIRRRAAAAG